MERLLWLLLSFRLAWCVLPYVAGLIAAVAFYVMIAGPTLPVGTAILATIAMTGGLMSGIKGGGSAGGNNPGHRSDRNRHGHS